MIELVGPWISPSKLTTVDTSAKFALGMRAWDDEGNEYKYLKGIGSTLVGSWVTYDEAGLTALLVANAKGPVAVAMGVVVASRWGWYCVEGTVEALLAENTAADSLIGRETTNGYAGDGRVSGDEIYGAIARDAVVTPAALGTVQINHPYVNDDKGA